MSDGAPVAPPPRRESELAGPIRRYLEAQGYTVWVDPDGTDYFDVAARRGEEVGLVELKLSDWRTLLAQAVDRRGYADWVAVALPRRPAAERLLARAALGHAQRIGVWTVVGESVTVLRSARPWAPSTRELFELQRRSLRALLDLRAGGLVPEGVELSAFPARAVRRPGGRSAREWRLEEFSERGERSEKPD